MRCDSLSSLLLAILQVQLSHLVYHLVLEGCSTHRRLKNLEFEKFLRLHLTTLQSVHEAFQSVLDCALGENFRSIV